MGLFVQPILRPDFSIIEKLLDIKRISEDKATQLNEFLDKTLEDKTNLRILYINLNYSIKFNILQPFGDLYWIGY